LKSRVFIGQKLGFSKQPQFSRQFRDTYGLMTNDSLIVAVMQRERIQYLATNDADFERIQGLAICRPE